MEAKFFDFLGTLEEIHYVAVLSDLFELIETVGKNYLTPTKAENLGILLESVLKTLAENKPFEIGARADLEELFGQIKLIAEAKTKEMTDFDLRIEEKAHENRSDFDLHPDQESLYGANWAYSSRHRRKIFRPHRAPITLEDAEDRFPEYNWSTDPIF